MEADVPAIEPAESSLTHNRDSREELHYIGLFQQSLN